MGTRSYVGVLNEDNTVRGHYIHFDGYPDGVGQTLVEHYQSIIKISEMIELGSLSILGEEIGQKHDFDTHGDWQNPDPIIEKWCLAYGRDRGEDGVEPRTFANTETYLKMAAGAWAEYAYLYASGKWWLYIGCKEPGVDLETYLSQAAAEPE